jgi:hypothetical protein
MLVCNVSAFPHRRIAAEVAEVAAANDAATIGTIVFDTLVDDPAAATDQADAYFGSLMEEAANAVDSVAGNIGGIAYIDSIFETVSAADSFSAGYAFDATLTEAITAGDTQDGSIPGPPPIVTPTTWNPSDKSASITLTGSNLTATATSSNAGVRGITSRSTGKFYWEATMIGLLGSGTEIGLATASATLDGNGLAGQAVLTNAKGASGRIWINGSDSGVGLGILSSGNIIGIATDLTTGKIWFRVTPSGNWNGSGTANPATGVGGVSLGALIGNTLFPFFGATFGNDKATANFGASAFNGSVPSGYASGWGT